MRSTQPISPAVAVTTTIIDSPKRNQQQQQSKYSSPPSLKQSQQRPITVTNTNRFGNNSTALSPRRQQDEITSRQLQEEIYGLERQILQEKLRGEWATRRLVALESVEVSLNPRSALLALTMSKRVNNNNDNNNSSSLTSSLLSFGNEENNNKNPYDIVKSPARTSIVKDLVARNLASLPTQSDFQKDLSLRIEQAEKQNRRIRDQIAEVDAMKIAQEKSHRDKMYALRQRRDQIRDRKFTVEAQLRVTEGALQDDDMLSDAQYRRYASRIESARQESQLRHETNKRVQTERSDLRCSMIQKETDDIVNSLKKLIQQKSAEIEDASKKEKSSLEVATKLGDRVEEIEHADSEIQRLSKRNDLLAIEERHLVQEKDLLTEEIRKAHFILLELDGKIASTGQSDLQKIASQHAKNEALMMSVRTLQERIAIASKRGRGREYKNADSTTITTTTGRDLVLLDTKLDELNKVNYTNRLELHNKELELTKLSDNYLHIDNRLKEVKLEGELLQAAIAQYRHDIAVSNARDDIRVMTQITNSGLTGSSAAGSLFLLNTLKK